MTVQPIEAGAIDLAFVPAPHSQIASVVVDGEAVIYDEQTGSIHLLNPTASMLWQCFDGICTLGELAQDVCEAFELDQMTAQRDVVETARALGRLGLFAGVAAEPIEGHEDGDGHG